MVALVNAPINTSKTRKPNGMYASEMDASGITRVFLPGWRVGYRVGPNGRIYADRDAAKRFAASRVKRLAVENAHWDRMAAESEALDRMSGLCL